jgi:hypothetical protein
LGYNTRLRVHSSFAKASHACHPLNEPFDADADEARPDHCLMDLFSWKIHFKESESKEDVDQAKFLERQFDLADAIPSCILVVTVRANGRLLRQPGFSMAGSSFGGLAVLPAELQPQMLSSMPSGLVLG